MKKFSLGFSDKERLRWVHQCEMKPCPKCGSYKIKPQTPIDLRDPSHQKMKGTVYFMCFECFHKGPQVSCAGMTRDQVGKSVELYTAMKAAWNSQGGA